MRFKYILTTKNFFKEGPCGRVSHAKGFVEGLSQNNQNITVLCDGGAKDYIDVSSKIKFKYIGFLFYFSCFYEILKSIVNKENIVIRWRFFLPYLFFPFLLLYKNIYFEVNTITGIKSKNILIRNAVKLSIVIVAKLSKIIVVSENSKKEIHEICVPKHDIYIMPNGFNPTPFLKFEPSLDPLEKPNLIYFGKKQEYYDWDMLFHVFEIQKNNFNKFYIFGFDGVNNDSIEFSGSFNHASLIEKISAIKNPVLILHPSDSQMAKSGSPMKLFEYASLNLPMIVGNSIQKQTTKLDGLVFYTSSDSHELSLALEKVALDYQLYFDQSQHLSKAVMENYTWSKIVSNWLKKLDS